MRLIPSIGIILVSSGIYSFYELAKFVENSLLGNDMMSNPL